MQRNADIELFTKPSIVKFCCKRKHCLINKKNLLPAHATGLFNACDGAYIHNRKSLAATVVE